MILNVGPKLREVHARTPIVMIAGVHLRGMNGIGNRNANGKTVKYMMETTTELSKISLLLKRRYLTPPNHAYLRRPLPQGQWPVVLVVVNVIVRARLALAAIATETVVINLKDRHQTLLLHPISPVLRIV